MHQFFFLELQCIITLPSLSQSWDLHHITLTRATKTRMSHPRRPIGFAAWSSPTAPNPPLRDSQTLGFKGGSRVFSQTKTTSERLLRHKRAAGRRGLTKHGLQVRQRHWNRGRRRPRWRSGIRGAELRAEARDRGPGGAEGILRSGEVWRGARADGCFARFRCSELRAGALGRKERRYYKGIPIINWRPQRGHAGTGNGSSYKLACSRGLRLGSEAKLCGLALRSGAAAGASSVRSFRSTIPVLMIPEYRWRRVWVVAYSLRQQCSAGTLNRLI